MSAFGEFTSVAPGSWSEIDGSNLATTPATWSSANFTGSNAPISLNGTSVMIGGQSAFIDYVSPGQVNAQVPSTVANGPQSVVVMTPSGTTSASTIFVNSTEPGLLAPTLFSIGGNQYVGALLPNGTTYILPPGAVAGITSQAAQPDQMIVLYGVGFGSVTPSIPAGQIVSQKTNWYCRS